MQPGPPRRRLRDVTLTGGRRLLRASLHVTIAASAAVAWLAFAFDRHRAGDGYWMTESRNWTPWHAFAVETYGTPLVACALTIMSAWWSRRRFPRGLLTGFLAGATAVGTFSLWIAVHLLDDLETNGAMDVGLMMLVPLFFAGLALMIVEPLLAVLERRRLEEEEKAVFPTARLVA